VANGGSGECYGRHETCDEGSANLAAIESETRELILAEAPSQRLTETDAEIVLLIEKIGATSIGEIEKLIGEMQEAKNFLQSEKERIQRETACYTKLAQTASCKNTGGPP
jgi:hypothetical protein